MGDLKVSNRAQGSSFQVKVEGNVTIKNFKGNRELKNNEAKTTVKNGKVSNSYKWSNTDHPTKESALNLNSTNYGIFDALRSADKSDKKGEKLTQSDLEALRTNPKLQKELGVQVKYDAKEKVYGIYGENGSTLYFDFD